MKNDSRVIRLSLLILSLCLILGTLAACSSVTGKKTNGKIQVVAAEDFYGEAAQAVGGEYVQVTSIINRPSMDPHDYEPTSATARAVSAAQVIVFNGIGYDGWMENLVTSNSGKKRVIRVGEDLMHRKDGDNEHLWYQPETMPILAQKLAAEFTAIAPKHAAYFQQKAAAYIDEIKPVREKVAALKNNSRGQKVDVSEPVFDYMIHAMGYTVANNHFERAVEHETDPSPKDILRMQRDIKKHRIAFLVSNSQEISPTVKTMMTLAEKYHVPVVKVTETLPSGKDYKTWMLDQLKQIQLIQKLHSAK